MMDRILRGAESWVVALCIIALTACTSDPPVPKPRVYPRIDWPTGEMTKIQPEDCPFSFSFPNYAVVVKQKPEHLPDEKQTHQCWFNLFVPKLNADLYFTYKNVRSREDFDRAVADSYRIISQVNRRSDYTEETVVRNSFGVTGVKYEFEGEAASPIHFYVSDTTQHFVKGALYYRHSVNADSMMPVSTFLKRDIDQLLATIRWAYDPQ